jgi:guanine nucleotide-binding protein G(I)/G(S)/G(T) subunit beta-1
LTASGGLDNLVTIYKIPEEGGNGELKPYKELSHHTGYISGAVFLDDEKVLSSSGDQKIVMWDIENSRSERVFSGHDQDVMDVSLIPNSNNNLFVSGSVDCTCKVWDHRDAKADVLTFVGHESDINAVDAMANGHSFASGSDDSKLLLHDMRSYGPLQRYHEAKIIYGVSSIGFSNSGRYLFGGYDDHNARCWDVLTGLKIQDLNQHTNRVSCLGVNTSGTALATGGWDFLVRVWAT